MKFEDINFDLDDKNLFLIDDLQLKADAIRHSILPKLEIITNHSIAKINDKLKTNVLQLSTVLKFPSFRKTRNKELNINYISSEAGLGGKRDAKLWKAILKKDGNLPMVIPFSLTYSLDDEGLSFFFNTSRYGLTMKDNSLFYNFHIKYKEEIANLINESNVSLLKYYKKNSGIYDIYPFSPLSDYLLWQKNFYVWDLPYYSKTIKYPISNIEIKKLVYEFIIFYPIYDSYLKLASGNKILIKEFILLLNDWIISLIYDESSLNKTTPNNSLKQDIDWLKLAETKIKVMPAIRWQVFQRDNWRCVACGRSSENGIILHVDHIIPRSKGGLDHLDNYQTLCETCNIGKSNKDQTNLRHLSK